MRCTCSLSPRIVASALDTFDLSARSEASAKASDRVSSDAFVFNFPWTEKCHEHACSCLGVDAHTISSVCSDSLARNTRIVVAKLSRCSASRYKTVRLDAI
jgi:hypothetical protein